VDLRIVCLNNGGGAIFDFLPLAEHAEPALYEEHIATPGGVDLARLAPGLIEVRTDRHQNVALHRAVVERVARTLNTR
jgi:2-succinyl-5-enolpyruvyl-6-hydroxy-3-cyclohexene-1-carboxylate synthase